MPPAAYWLSLVAVTTSAFALRMALRRPLLPRLARPVGDTNAALLAVALLALGFHCGAMFFADTVTLLPGSDGAISSVNALDLASKVAYALPAMLAVVALRRIWLPALALFATSLLIVGLTMFWWLGLWVHLTAIAMSLTVLSVVVSALVRLREGPAGQPTSGARPAIEV